MGNKTYIITLTTEEIRTLEEIISKSKSNSKKVRKAYVLLASNTEGLVGQIRRFIKPIKLARVK